MSDSVESASSNKVIEPAAFSRPDAPKNKPWLQPSPAKLAVLAVFVVLAVAALFMFQARAVKFVTEPVDANVTITSGLPTYLLGERFLMLPGEYEVTASAAGYFAVTDLIEVGSEPDQDIEVTLTKLPGVVSFNASFDGQPINGAEVYIDQVAGGTTPITLDDVPAGTREILIKHPRYQAYQIELDVLGMRNEQQITAELTPAWAKITVDSLPSEAELLIDDISVAKTPAVIEVLEGKHTLKVRKAGYKIYESELEVVALASEQLPTISLIKSDGKLNVVSDPIGVNITISGRYYGQTPLAVALPPSESYELLASKAGFENIRRPLKVRPEEDQSLNLRMKAIKGTVRFAVTPANARLFVDNKDIGAGNQTLELTARTHRVRVELPGYATWESEVLPQPGLSQQINVVMQTEEAARVSAIPQVLATSTGDRLRFIIPERLQMGAGRREPGRRSNEIQKDVTLTRAFYLGEKEISNQTYQLFDPGHDSGLLGRALLSDPDRPVVNVPWFKAVEFCNWLSRKDGLPEAYEQINGQWHLVSPFNTGYRLPTEAEWAWASRYATGRQGTRFPWGDNMPPTDGSGNFADESAANMVPYSIKNYNDSFRGPAPSGSYDPNELGIFDLAGNVSEWIHDFYSIELAREPQTDPIGPDSGDYRVIRGSNYTHGRFSELRWTFRDYGADARPDVGFRLARFADVDDQE